MILKKCCICEDYFPGTLEFFHKRSGADDGLRCDCKSCRKLKKLKDYQKENKKCSKCNELKPNTSEFFNIKNGGIRARSRSLCKECHKKDMRKNHLLRQYNLTEERYSDMYTKQKGRCKICESFHVLLHVDHNHKTNEIRELLCDNCNRGIGYLKEDLKTLENAIKYIAYHNKNTN